MSRRRTRNSGAKAPGYITPEGYRKLEAEAERLWRVERPAMTRNLAAAAAEGDRSENAEYIYSKKKLAEIDRRLRFLTSRLDALTVVTEPPPADGRVYFGCVVTLEDEAGELVTYQLVGPDETELGQRRISVDSPMGKALLGREEGDEVVVHRPRGPAAFVIDRVEAPSGAGRGGRPQSG